MVKTCFDFPEWKNTKARDYRDKLLELLGKPYSITPDAVTWEGYLVEDKTSFQTLTIKDESILTPEPVKHFAFLYSSVEFEIAEFVIPVILKTTKSVFIDHLKRRVCVRSDSLLRNAVILGFVFDVSRGKIKENKANQEYSYRMKKNLIGGIFNNWFIDPFNEGAMHIGIE